jgi:hypothetical protein
VAPVSGLVSFAPGSLIIDMGQTTQTVGNALKPYGLVYDLVTNFKVPVDWAINPAKTTFAFNNPAASVDFTATTPRGRRTSAADRSSSTRPSSRLRSSPTSTAGKPRAWWSIRWRPP